MEVRTVQFNVATSAEQINKALIKGPYGILNEVTEGLTDEGVRGIALEMPQAVVQDYADYIFGKKCELDHGIIDPNAFRKEVAEEIGSLRDMHCLTA